MLRWLRAHLYSQLKLAQCGPGGGLKVPIQVLDQAQTTSYPPSIHHTKGKAKQAGENKLQQMDAGTAGFPFRSGHSRIRLPAYESL